MLKVALALVKEANISSTAGMPPLAWKLLSAAAVSTLPLGSNVEPRQPTPLPKDELLMLQPIGIWSTVRSSLDKLVDAEDAPVAQRKVSGASITTTTAIATR